MNYLKESRKRICVYSPPFKILYYRWELSNGITKKNP